MKFKAVIPKNVDPIGLADKIKRGMSIKFLHDMKRLRQTRIKSRLVQQS